MYIRTVKYPYANTIRSRNKRMNELTPLQAIRSTNSFDEFYPAVRRSLLAGRGVIPPVLHEWGLRFAKQSLKQRAEHVRQLTEAMRDAVGTDRDVVENAYHSVSCTILSKQIMDPTLGAQQLELFMALGALAELSPSPIVQNVWAQHTYYQLLHEGYLKNNKEDNYNEVARTVLSSRLTDAMKLRFLNAPLRTPIWTEPENVDSIYKLLESRPESVRWACLPLRRGTGADNARTNRILMAHYVPQLLSILDVLGDDGLTLVSPTGETTPYFKHIRAAAQAMEEAQVQPVECCIPDSFSSGGGHSHI